MKYHFDNQRSDLNSRARASFVQKVYTILSIQLAVTTLFVLLNIYSATFAYIQYRYTFLNWVMIAVSIITLIALSKICLIQALPLDFARPTQLIFSCLEFLQLLNHMWCQAYAQCTHPKAFCSQPLQPQLQLSVLHFTQ